MSDESLRDDNWQQLVTGLRDGDERIVRQFCSQYGPQLERVAEKNLAAGLRRRVGPDDVAQSVCRTFLRRAQGGEFELEDSDALWRLLCAITLTKAKQQARFHLRQKRGVNQEAHLDSIAPGGGPKVPPPELACPTPDEAVEFADEFDRLLSGFDEDERRLVDLKLQNCTQEEIAQRLGCSERTVRRMLKRVQSRLASEFDLSIS